MLLYWAALVLLTTTCVEARIFDNPILSNNTRHYYPKAIRLNDTYYVVTQTPDISKGMLSIHTSTDLVEWKSAGFVFYDCNAPLWVDNTTLNTPVIHQVGSNFLVYFSAVNTTSSKWTADIGVALAAHPLGPYLSVAHPIVSQPNHLSLFPSIINDQDKLYLVWSEGYYKIMARQLNSNGLIFASEQAIFSLMKPNLTWENGFMYAPWYLRRGNYHYLIYSGDCNGIGVARSSSALGPYEKLANPIIKSNNVYSCIQSASVVNNLIFFSAYKKDDKEAPRSVVMTSVSWSANDWPEVLEF